jgi:hypothetical protein
MASAGSFPAAKIAVSVLDNNKAKGMFIQVTEKGGNHFLSVFETDASKRARNILILQQSVAEDYPQDVTRRSISITGPNDVVVISFPTEADARGYRDLVNSKSDIFKDSESIRQLDRNIAAVWPFPCHQ